MENNFSEGDLQWTCEGTIFIILRVECCANDCNLVFTQNQLQSQHENSSKLLSLTQSVHVHVCWWQTTFSLDFNRLFVFPPNGPDLTTWTNWTFKGIYWPDRFAFKFLHQNNCGNVCRVSYTIWQQWIITTTLNAKFHKNAKTVELGENQDRINNQHSKLKQNRVCCQLRQSKPEKIKWNEINEQLFGSWASCQWKNDQSVS